MENLKKEYENFGFFKLENVFEKIFIKKIIDEINSCKELACVKIFNKDNKRIIRNNVDVYYDKKGSLRRMERLYDKGEALKSTNKKILNLLKEIFNYEFTIFKDKYNAKPSGGEGFFAHYDGIFKFKNENDEYKKGWYEYGDFFVNALIALVPSDVNNGTIEIANAQKGSFDELLSNTKKNGTPDLLPEIEKKLKFKAINLNIGDVIIFSNTCPHRSKKNNSNVARKLLYYTYTPLKYGSKYEKYFIDKSKSKNENSRSLSGEL